MSFTKITNAQLNSRGATTLPNQPTISATALKQEFDAPAKNIVAPAVNNLIDELEATTAAADLGAVAPAGRTGATVQAVINAISGDLATLEASVGTAIADAHTHTNKALLDTYTQTDTDIGDAVTKKHSHGNKALLDTYTQTETDLADAVSKKHAHSNKALLDTYTQTEANLADAVSKKHAHSNGTLLDTYTQTEANLADAVTKKHAHTNKAQLDKIGEDSGGNPTYDGNPIGGGGASDVFKNIVAAGTTFTASGSSDTFKINAGSNVTITALASPDKGIKIDAAGGGTSTGDMLMSDYDSSGTVKTAGGITAYVSSAISGKQDTLSQGTGISISSNTVSVDFGSVSSGNAKPVSGGDVYTAVNNKADNTQTFSQASSRANIASGETIPTILGKIMKWFADLADLAFISKDGGTSTKYLRGDGTWQAFPSIPAAANNATLTIQQNGTTKGTFTADASTNASANIVTDQWHGTSGTVSSGTVSFSGVDDSDNNGYELFVTVTSSSTNKNPTAQISSISGEGTSSMSITFTTDADNGATCKLRIIK